MPDLVPVVLASTLILTLVDFATYVRTRNWDAVVKNVLAYGGGIGVAFLLRASDFAAGIDVGDLRLGAVNAATVVLFGLGLGSLAVAGVKGLKAFDSSRSSSAGNLL